VEAELVRPAANELNSPGVVGNGVCAPDRFVRLLGEGIRVEREMRLFTNELRQHPESVGGST